MNDSSRIVLVVAAHPDDEVLGAGGAMARHTSSGDRVYVAILTEGATVQFPGQPEKIELKKSQALQAAEILGIKEVFFGDFPDQKLDTIPVLDVTAFLEKIVRQIQPNIVYTHHYSELNRDHRIACEATSVAVRPFHCPSLERLLCFTVDTIVQTGQGLPQYNVFVDIGDTLEIKLKAMQAYETEVREYPHPRSLAALRHAACRNGSLVGLKAAEVFHMILELKR